MPTRLLRRLLMSASTAAVHRRARRSRVRRRCRARSRGRAGQRPRYRRRRCAGALRCAAPAALFGQRLPRFPADDGGADAPIDDEPPRAAEPEHLCLTDQRHHLGSGPWSYGLGCTGISTRSAASSAEAPGGDARRAVDDDVIGAARRLWRLMQCLAGEATALNSRGKPCWLLRCVQSSDEPCGSASSRMTCDHAAPARRRCGWRARGLADAAFLVEKREDHGAALAAGKPVPAVPFRGCPPKRRATKVRVYS